jgi:CRISPR-associated protein Csm3
MIKVYTLRYELELLTGLHIGGYESTFDIGGADSSVIKNPLNRKPYIPGSSIKGKLRALLSYKYGEPKDGALEFEDKEILNIFSAIESDDKNKPNITRAIFRDLNLTSGSIVNLEKMLGKGIFTEIKAENRIDAFSGKSLSPRFIERVPAGVVFEGEINLIRFEGDNIKKMKSLIEESLDLLELNYLGGSGSRGYGRVKIKKEDWINENI